MKIKKGTVLTTEDGEMICVARDGKVAVFADYHFDIYPVINFGNTYVYDVTRPDYGPITKMVNYAKSPEFSLLEDESE